jgi:hypothetical protein
VVSETLCRFVVEVAILRFSRGVLFAGSQLDGVTLGSNRTVFPRKPHPHHQPRKYEGRHQNRHQTYAQVDFGENDGHVSESGQHVQNIVLHELSEQVRHPNVTAPLDTARSP